jgi:hypothetical protein
MTPLSKVQMAISGLLGWLEGVLNDVASMSAKEFSRLDVLLGIEAGRLSIRDACALIGLRRRQIFRLLAASGRMEAPAWFQNVAGGRATIVCQRLSEIWP